MLVKAVGIVGAQNNPLYVRSFDGDDGDLGFHYIIHMALDVIQERVKQAISTNDSLYLGFLGPIEDSVVYAYMTNTQVKLIIVLQEGSRAKDPDMRAFMKEFHHLYVKAVSNPFSKIGDCLNLKRFDDQVYNMVLKKQQSLR